MVARRWMWASAVAVAVVASMTFIACEPARGPAMPRGGEPALHAVHAKDVHVAMEDLEAVSRGNLQLDLYTGQSSLDMKRVAESAGKMADSADKLPAAIANVQMDAKAKDVYLTLAGALRDQSLVLKQQAGKNDLAGARVTVGKILNTCDSCHTMFRSVAEPKR